MRYDIDRADDQNVLRIQSSTDSPDRRVVPGDVARIDDGWYPVRPKLIVIVQGEEIEVDSGAPA
jgi:hypothetical protein